MDSTCRKSSQLPSDLVCGGFHSLERPLLLPGLLVLPVLHGLALFLYVDNIHDTGWFLGGCGLHLSQSGHAYGQRCTRHGDYIDAGFLLVGAGNGDKLPRALSI